MVSVSGGTQLSVEEGSAVHKSESNVSSLVDGQQAVWFDISELGRCTGSRAKCLQSNGSDPQYVFCG